jgi:hypothetical protein
LPPTSSTLRFHPLLRKEFMAQTDGFGPSFPGPIAAQSFQSTLVSSVAGTYGQLSMRVIPQRINVLTNGTAEVNVFGSTNPVSGTFLSARVISKDDGNGNITLQHTSAGTVVFTIAKGSAGGVKGTYFAATAFAAGATATIKSSGATGDAVVEIDFIASNPKLPGAQ